MVNVLPYGSVDRPTGTNRTSVTEAIQNRLSATLQAAPNTVLELIKGTLNTTFNGLSAASRRLVGESQALISDLSDQMTKTQKAHILAKPALALGTAASVIPLAAERSVRFAGGAVKDVLFNTTSALITTLRNTASSVFSPLTGQANIRDHTLRVVDSAKLQETLIGRLNNKLYNLFDRKARAVTSSGTDNPPTQPGIPRENQPT